MTPEEILKQYWGHENFRPPQASIIQSILSGKDTVAILPTGGGKSICFQVPALLKEGVALVVTPLIALMEDQVQQLKKRGIRATAVHSGMTRAEIDIALDNCIYGSEKLLYLSPERLQTEIFRERAKKMNISLVAIDEAHCISQWGYDFRPSYLQIAELREWKPGVPFVALTASATREVKQDIIEKLLLKQPGIFQNSITRPNVAFVVRRSENKEKQMLDVLRKVQGPSIVYVRSRKVTQEIARWLTRNHIAATYYHAGLDHRKRKERQEEWVKGSSRVIVATNAFGMGIDKADVRTVIHFDLPENPESYYQEAGRAGRDRKHAYAVMIVHPSDEAALRSKVEQSHPDLAYLKKVYQALANYYQLAVGSSGGESYDFDLIDFCRRFSLKSPVTFAALKRLEESGLISLSDGYYKPSQLHIDVDKKKLYEFQVANVKYDGFLKTVLRLYGGEVFNAFMPISESQIAAALKLDNKEVRGAFQRLEKLQLIKYVPASDAPQITFILPRQDAQYLPVDRVNLDRLRKLNLEKMEQMLNYARQHQQCRMQWLQVYFDEDSYQDCGICDVCISRKKKENLAALADFESQVLYLLKQKPMPLEDLEREINPADHELFVEVIREMVDGGVIAYDGFWVLGIVKK